MFAPIEFLLGFVRTRIIHHVTSKAGKAPVGPCFGISRLVEGYITTPPPQILLIEHGEK